MKYPKVLQMLALATAITVAVPNVAMPAAASETAETPQEYAERTGYVLPSGYHYILDGEYIILNEEGLPVIEADSAPPEEAPASPETPEETGEPEDTDTSGDTTAPGEDSAAGQPEDGKNPENSGDGEKTEDSGDGEAAEQPGSTGNPGEEDTGKEPGNEKNPENPGNGEAEEQPGSTVNPGEEDTGKEPGNEKNPENPGDGEAEEQPGGIVTPGDDGFGKLPEVEGGTEGSLPEEEQGAQTSDEGEEETEDTADVAEEAAIPGAEEFAEETGAQDDVQLAGAEEYFLTSEQFKAVRDRIQYNVEVPIKGLPSFITQEMIVGALKAQDETGYPASVTIAQIIQESGYGKYGPGGEDGKGLSYLAFEYCNLFGIKGTGTAGSVSMKTSEMEPNGKTYSTYAGFRVYNTYTECIEDRSKLLDEVYSDLTKDVTDANTFAMKIGRRWATDLQYGKHLIRTMQKYDLYRLDDLTLNEFSDMMGDFANPCPGSTITSLFGRRTAPIAGATTYHKGVDLGTGAYHIPTYAAREGVVVFAGEAGACGNLITIDHGDGMVTKYMHHSEIYVEEGQKVEKGQQIGLSGTTGNSTGNHLHFQVEENGRAVDPLIYLQDDSGDAKDRKAKGWEARRAECRKSLRKMNQKISEGVQAKR